MNRLRAGSVSCVNLVEQCMEAAKVHKPLNAFISMTDEETLLKEAKLSDERYAAKKVLSKIDGMPVAVKDNFCSGLTTAGSRMLANFNSPYEATVVERLRAAGAIIVGKTNMDEFGMGSYGANSYFGPTFTRADYVSGGSSSGSAVACQHGLCITAIGSDTGGSARCPASFCNVIGFKPSYGRVSRWGMISYASSLDTPAILGTKTEDVSDVLDVIAGPDKRDATCMKEVFDSTSRKVDAKKIGIPIECFVDELPDTALAAWESVADKLQKRMNAEVVPVSIPSIRDALPAYYVIACAEASSNLSRYDGVQYGHRTSERDQLSLHEEYILTRNEGFGKEVKRRLLMGSYVLSR